MTEISSFTEDARSILNAARTAAERLGHRAVETDHLLIGIAFDQSSAAGRALREAGANPARIEAAMQQYRPPSAPHEGTPDLSPAVQRLLEKAGQSGGGEITPEHLLRVLLEETKGLSHMALREMRISPDIVQRRMKVYAEHRQGGRTLPFDRAQRGTPKPAEPPKFRTGRQIAAGAGRPSARLPRLSGGSPLVTLGITALAALGGYVITGIIVQSLIPAVGAGAGAFVGWVIGFVGLLIALIIPPLMAGQSAQNAAATYRSTPWGRVGALLFRLRWWLAGLVAISPLYLWGMNILATQLGVMRVGSGQIPAFVSFSITNLIITFLGYGFFGVTLGVALALRRRAGNPAVAAALLTFLGLALTVGLLAISVAFGWSFRLVAILRLFAPIIPFVLGLLALRRAEGR